MKKTIAIIALGTLVVATTALFLSHPCSWGPNPPSPSPEPEEPSSADSTGAP